MLKQPETFSLYMLLELQHIQHTRFGQGVIVRFLLYLIYCCLPSSQLETFHKDTAPRPSNIQSNILQLLL